MKDLMLKVGDEVECDKFGKGTIVSSRLGESGKVASFYNGIVGAYYNDGTSTIPGRTKDTNIRRVENIGITVEEDIALAIEMYKIGEAPTVVISSEDIYLFNLRFREQGLQLEVIETAPMFFVCFISELV